MNPSAGAARTRSPKDFMMKKTILNKFHCLILFGFTLMLASCSIPDADRENELMDGVRRYIVTVGIKPDTFKENIYLVFDAASKNAVIIDPGSKSKKMETFIESRKLKIRWILNTHGHFDHTFANQYYSRLYQAPIATHQADAEFFREENAINKPGKYFSTEEYLDAGFKIQIIAVPGHSRGSVCFLINGRLFSGDTLFHGGIGRVWGASEAEEQKKTRELIGNVKTKLLVLPETTLVFPGHGEFTDIGREKQYNPYLQ